MCPGCSGSCHAALRALPHRFYDQDVEIIVEGLIEDTDYEYIYCYAEDDEDTLGGMARTTPPFTDCRCS